MGSGGRAPNAASALDVADRWPLQLASLEALVDRAAGLYEGIGGDGLGEHESSVLKLNLDPEAILGLGQKLESQSGGAKADADRVDPTKTRLTSHLKDVLASLLKTTVGLASDSASAGDSDDECEEDELKAVERLGKMHESLRSEPTTRDSILEGGRGELDQIDEHRRRQMENHIRELLKSARSAGEGRADRIARRWLEYITREVHQFKDNKTDKSTEGYTRVQDHLNELEYRCQLEAQYDALRDRLESLDQLMTELRSARERKPASKASMEYIEQLVLKKVDVDIRLQFRQETLALLARARQERNIVAKRSAEAYALYPERRVALHRRMQELLKLHQEWAHKQEALLTAELEARRRRRDELQEGRLLRAARRCRRRRRPPTSRSARALAPRGSKPPGVSLCRDFRTAIRLSCPGTARRHFARKV